MIEDIKDIESGNKPENNYQQRRDNNLKISEDADTVIDNEEEYAAHCVEDGAPADHEGSELEDLDVGEFGDLAAPVQHVLEDDGEQGHVDHHADQYHRLKVAVEQSVESCSGHVDVGPSHRELRAFISCKHIR